MSKKCPSGHDNPDSARFCRICGRPFIDDNSDLLDKLNRYISHDLTFLKNSLNDLYESLKRRINSFRDNDGTTSSVSNITTPEVFSYLSLIPISVYNIRFVDRTLFATLIICTIALYLERKIGFIRNILMNIQDYDFSLLYTLGGYGLLCLWCVLIIWFLYIMILKFIFKINVSYIENANIIYDYVRVAKNKKLGLYDTKNNIMRLWTRYDRIEYFDNDHLLVGRNNKVGIYSLNKLRIIIPIEYMYIGQFSNFMARATNGSIVDHYDINGNKLK